MTTQPLVTVICPTTHDRTPFNEAILNTFLRQDYHHKDILFDFEAGTIGEKRNRLCEKARGEIIVCMDSDDLYADDWISKSVEFLLQGQYHVVGLNQINLWDAVKREAWQYTYPADKPRYCPGATQCFLRSFWEDNKFPVMNIGEDEGFVRRTRNVGYIGYLEGFLASIHSGNTSKRALHNVRYRRLGEEEEEGLIKHWKL